MSNSRAPGLDFLTLALSRVTELDIIAPGSSQLGSSHSTAPYRPYPGQGTGFSNLGFPVCQEVIGRVSSDRKCKPELSRLLLKYWLCYHTSNQLIREVQGKTLE